MSLPSSKHRYAVGIDLGTTNSALADVDLAVEPAGPGEPLPGPMSLFVPQLSAPGELAEAELLASCVYLPSQHEAPPGSYALPWDATRTFAVGRWARDRGAQVPGRLVSSAKSWLSHTGIDPRAPLLPLRPAGAPPDDIGRISPVEASARVLAHLREAWESAHAHEQAEGGGPLRLADQSVTLTVPASFDPQARELTVAAAAQAGLAGVTLLEEPQAALYAWVQAAGDEWRRDVRPGDVILVIDVGGGTSDFSLIGVQEGTGAEQGQLRLDRLAVGEHILLGGDNIDLALAYRAAEKLKAQGSRLDAWQLQALTFACRQVKEDPSRFVDGVAAVSIAGRGSGLLGGLLRAEMTYAEVRAVIEAFFPVVDAEAAPQLTRRAGLATLGLPYAQDPAVTRHLAAFLRRNAAHRPTALLFNGGVFQDHSLQERVSSLVGSWMGAPLKQLSAAGGLDVAVSVGAAYAGLARAGRGIRIRGGTARAYYVGVEAAMPAVPGLPPPVRAICLAPFGMEEGSSVDLPKLELGAVVGERTSFRFFASEERREDVAGTVVEQVEGLRELPEIETQLTVEGRTEGTVMPVGLRAAVTEVGTLALHVVSRDTPGLSWKLEFSVRQGGPVELTQSVSVPPPPAGAAG